MPVVATPHQRASIVTTLKAVRSPRRQALQQGRLQRRISVSLTRGASPTGRYNRGVVESSLANAHFIVSWSLFPWTSYEHCHPPNRLLD